MNTQRGQNMRSRLPIRLHAAIAALIIGAFLVPIAAAFLFAFMETRPPDTPSPLLDWRLLFTTLVVAALAATLASAAGAIVSMLLCFVEVPRAELWAMAMLLPFACPSTVWALAQAACYGPGGMIEQGTGDALRPLLTKINQGGYAGTVLVLAQIHMPLAMFIVGRGWKRLGAMGLDAARLFLRGPRFLTWSFRAVRPELLGSWLLTFALCTGNFAAPHVLQCRLYTIDVYQRMTNYLDPAGALRAASPLVALVVIAALGIAALERNQQYTNVAIAVPHRTNKTHWRFYATAALVTYLTVTTLLPIVALILQCRSLQFFTAAVRDAAPEIENSLRIAGGAALIAGLAALPAGLWAARRKRVFSDALIVLPIATPPLLIGLCYSRFFNRSEPLDLTWVGDTMLLVIIGMSARSWPFAARLVCIGRRRIANEWLDACTTANLSFLQRWRWVTGPLLWESWCAGALLAFLLSLGEVEISQMLCAPGSGTLALRLFTFLHFGPSHVAASLAVVEMTLAIAPLGLYFLVFRRRMTLI